MRTMGTQTLPYDQFMAPLTRVAIRLSASQLAILDKIAAKTGLNRTSVMRLAITRLAEAENVKLPRPSE
jgi:uncharacterized protein (DUF1778 family)